MKEKKFLKENFFFDRSFSEKNNFYFTKEKFFSWKKNRAMSSGVIPEGEKFWNFRRKNVKKGSYPRHFFLQKSAKKVQKVAFSCIFLHFFCKKCQKNALLKKTVLRIRPRVFCDKGTSSPWQKPANLYSTKCRIFGIPHPCPGGAPWWHTTSPTPAERVPEGLSSSQTSALPRR